MRTAEVDNSEARKHETRDACPVCGLCEGYPISDRARDGTVLRTVLCAGCGVARTDPMPSADDLAAFYRDEYRVEYKGVQIPRRKHVLRAARLATERLRILREDVPPGRTLLDIGAGGGEFVYLAGASGFKARGIEPNAGYANYARETLGLPVESGVWQSANIGVSSIGAVTMFHVLEHLPDPVTCLQTVGRWLEPGGVLFVEVPNLCTPVGDPARRFHKAHLLHFTPETLRFTARKAGLSVLWSAASGDGANVRMMARVAELESDNPEVNEATSREILAREGYRASHPYLRPRAWLRLLKRAAAAAEEMVVATLLRDRKAILDRYARSL